MAKSKKRGGKKGKNEPVLAALALVVISISIFFIVKETKKESATGVPPAYPLPVKHQNNKEGPYDFWYAAATGKQMRHHRSRSEVLDTPRHDEYFEEPRVVSKIFSKRAAKKAGISYPYCKYNSLGNENGVPRALCMTNLNCQWVGDEEGGKCRTRLLDSPVVCPSIKNKLECMARADRCYYDKQAQACATRPL